MTWFQWSLWFFGWRVIHQPPEDPWIPMDIEISWVSAIFSASAESPNSAGSEFLVNCNFNWSNDTGGASASVDAQDLIFIYFHSYIWTALGKMLVNIFHFQDASVFSEPILFAGKFMEDVNWTVSTTWENIPQLWLAFMGIHTSWIMIIHNIYRIYITPKKYNHTHTHSTIRFPQPFFVIVNPN